MTFNSSITDLTGYCIMAKTSFSFCPLLLCSSPRDIKFQYEEKKEFLYIRSCKFLPGVSYFQGINSIVGSSHSSPSVLQPHATLRTTRNTHATLHATLPKCYQGQHFGSGQKNRLVFSFHSLKASKLQNAAPASSSVVLRVV